MSIRFKVDEDLPRDIAPMLRARGHDAATVVEERLGGAPDSRVWEVAQHEHRCLVTADKGFANVSKFPPGSHSGIILLRLSRESRAGYIRLVDGFLARFQMDMVNGAIVSVSPDAIRVHGRAQ